MAYLLKCKCGKSVAVGPTDAGRRMACVCGKAVEVPNLTVLRRMKPAEEKGRGKQPNRKPDDPESTRNLKSGRAWLLGGGLILLAGVVMSVGGHHPGACVDVVGLGAVLLGGLRLARGLVQRKTDPQYGG